MPIVHSCSVDHKVFDGGKEVEGKWVLPRNCPCCGEKGSLHRWASYWRSALDFNNTTDHKVRVIQMRCKVCKKTVVVLPSFLAPYQRVISATREAIVKLWQLGTSLRCLDQRTNYSRRTIGRWVKRVVHRASLLQQHLSQLCHEHDPSLSVYSGTTKDSPYERANIINQAIWWVNKWKELKSGLTSVRKANSWADVNTFSIVQAMNLWF
jgi:transposase-like protein